MKRFLWCVGLVAAMHGCGGGGDPVDGGALDGADDCATGLVRCGDRCVDVSSSPDACGACDVACGDGEVCSGGMCATTCPAGQTDCEGGCFDTDVARAHCGACGAACGDGEVCSSGSCGLSCGGDTPTLCGGGCVDTGRDRDHCGGCDLACGDGEVCADGVCTTSCPSGQLVCDGLCVDPDTDRAYCGATGSCADAEAGVTCDPGAVCVDGACATSCPAGQLECGGRCVDPSTDRAFCGASGDCTGSDAGATCAAGELCAAGSCDVSCPAGQIECGGACVDPATDRDFCGASGACTGADAGASCAAGEVCAAGACATSCPPGQIECGGRCVDPDSDRNFCGASASCAGPDAGDICGAGEVCAAGTCATSCPSGQLVCGGRCVDPSSDRAFCGAAGTCSGPDAGAACVSGEICVAGACATSCPSGQIACGGRCVDPNTDRAYCGASMDCGGANAGVTCGAGEVCAAGICDTSCPAGQIACGGRCVDPNTDRVFCGASMDCAGANAGAMCSAGEVCAAGTCATSCPSGQVDCAGRCVDPSTDPTYCGASADCAGMNAGDTCTAGEVCAAGVCSASCPSGQVACGGRCVDPSTDPVYCGASADCAGMNAGDTCASGEVCGMGTCTVSCPSGQLACGGRCVDPDTDPVYCGAAGDCAGVNAGDTCASGEVCGMGTCSLSCPSGQIACGGRCVDPDTDRAFCGASGTCAGMSAGTTCSPGEICAMGACTTSCSMPFSDCMGVCTDTDIDPANCGGCGTACAAATNATPVCVGGGCGQVCNSGFADCNVDLSDGCEADLSSASSCGACGNVCASGVCDAGSCGHRSLDAAFGLGTGEHEFAIGGGTVPLYVDDDFDGGGWVLVGRGREDWGFSDAGAGMPEDVRTGRGTTAAFTPTYLASALIQELIDNSAGIDFTDTEIWLRRAAAADGSGYQDVRWRPLSRTTWTWVYDGGGPGVESYGAPIGFGISHVVGPSAFGPGGTYPSTNTEDTFAYGSVTPNDYQRVFTWDWGGHGNKDGFGYGLSTTGGSTSPTTFLYSENAGDHPLPYTEVYVRRRRVVTAFSGDANLSTFNTAGRSCADGGEMVSYSVTGLGAMDATLSAAPSAGCLSAGDEVLLINLQGHAGSAVNVGNVEVLQVASVAGSTVTFTAPKSNFYGDGASDDTNLGAGAGTQRVVLQRVPVFDAVTVAAGVTLTVSPWDGTRGGVFAMRATSGFTLDGAVDVSGRGYRGGARNTTAFFNGAQGESIVGVGAPNTTSANVGGGGGGTGEACGSFGHPGGGGGHTAAGGAGAGGGCGGGAGMAYGVAGRWLFGSGGGSGGADNTLADNPPGGFGGAGGGIAVLIGDVSGAGAVLAEGASGEGDPMGVSCTGASTTSCWDYSGPGGGGAGGTVATSGAFGATVSVAGGPGGFGYDPATDDGGAGSVGVVNP
ncbi:MAG: hypothetical protein RIB77_44605 [Sandaracinaceae bacterium]